MVSDTLKKIVYPCWRPSVSRDGDDNMCGCINELWWYKDAGEHVNGRFSMAVIQANNVLEDHCQLESGFMSSVSNGPRGTFIGVYDGHGGPEASQFVNDCLFSNIQRYTSENRGMSANVIKKAFLETEEEFLSIVRNNWAVKPQLASVGTCCLAGVICDGQLYIANSGDSRVVLGRYHRASKEVQAVQLSSEHNASLASVRDELHTLHPDDPEIVVLKHNVWRVKGIIQISRSIGDAYLKNTEFNRPPLLPKFRLAEPFEKPILLAEPSIFEQKLYPEDQFLIFASDGLWEHLTNQQAVDIVLDSPHKGIARKLIKAALHVAANKREMRYSDLKKINRGVRRHFHDDITVIVVYLDHSHMMSRSAYYAHDVSIKDNGEGSTCI